MESELWKFITSQPLGIALLIMFIVGLSRKWGWVMRWQYEKREMELLDRIREEKERVELWQHAALRGTGLLEETAQTLRAVTRNPLS